MLTKDLIQTRKRGSRIYPGFISADDVEIVRLAEQTIALFQDGVGKTVAEIESELKQITSNKTKLLKVGKGFQKILMQRFIDVDDHLDAQEQRWDVLRKAQDIRKAHKELSGFHEELAQTLALTPEVLSERLYADLPQFRRVSSFQALAKEDLINLYNVQLVQGLLLLAKNIRVRMRPLTIKQKRTYCHLAKFQRLILEVDDMPESEAAKGEFGFTLTGPLSLFEQASKYGLKFATYFPYILHTDDWEIESKVKLNQKEYDLKLDSKSCQLRPTRKAFNTQLPGELSECLEKFNTKMKAQGVTAAVSDRVFNFGREHYSVADISLSKPEESGIHIELFHRWHSSQLFKILAIPKDNLADDYYIGISSQLVKNPKLQRKLADSQWLQERMFEFREFPTSKHLISMWERVKVRNVP